MTGVWVGVDVGGTKILAGAVDEGGHVHRHAHLPTPANLPGAEESLLVESALVEAVARAAAGERVAGVGIAAAGFVDAAGETVVFAPHLPWRSAPLRERLEQRLGVPVTLDNDATCAALAEATYGAARLPGLSVTITVGTGIGGGLVLDGRVLRGQGMAGEFGHMQVVPDGLPCQCGRTGCWEEYCSGSALVRLARAAVGHGPTLLADACDGDPARLTGPMVTAAAEDGDLAAREAFASVGHWLGVGAANVVAALDPAVVVVGGGLVEAGERLLAPAREVLSGVVGAGHRPVPPLVPAVLGQEAGLVGAATMARLGR